MRWAGPGRRGPAPRGTLAQLALSALDGAPVSLWAPPATPRRYGPGGRAPAAPAPPTACRRSAGPARPLERGVTAILLGWLGALLAGDAACRCVRGVFFDALVADIFGEFLAVQRVFDDSGVRVEQLCVGVSGVCG